MAVPCTACGYVTQFTGSEAAMDMDYHRKTECPGGNDGNA